MSGSLRALPGKTSGKSMFVLSQCVSVCNGGCGSGCGCGCGGGNGRGCSGGGCGGGGGDGGDDAGDNSSGEGDMVLMKMAGDVGGHKCVSVSPPTLE